jgi:hypothetical protein
VQRNREGSTIQIEKLTKDRRISEKTLELYMLPKDLFEEE